MIKTSKYITTFKSILFSSFLIIGLSLFTNAKVCAQKSRSEGKSHSRKVKKRKIRGSKYLKSRKVKFTGKKERPLSKAPRANDAKLDWDYYKKRRRQAQPAALPTSNKNGIRPQKINNRGLSGFKGNHKIRPPKNNRASSEFTGRNQGVRAQAKAPSRRKNVYKQNSYQGKIKSLNLQAKRDRAEKASKKQGDYQGINKNKFYSKDSSVKKFQPFAWLKRKKGQPMRKKIKKPKYDSRESEIWYD